MQNGAKRIKRWKGQKPYCQKHVDMLKKLEENMSIALVRAAAAAARRPCAGDAAHSAQAVDWIMQPVDWNELVDWMECTGKNQSTGSWQRVQRRNPSRRKEQRNAEIQRSLTLKNHISQSRRNFAMWSTAKL